MPTPKRKPSSSQARYHVYRVSDDLGEVKGHPKPEDAINAVVPEPVARPGLYCLAEPSGAVTFVLLTERASVTVDIVNPKDLFK